MSGYPVYSLEQLIISTRIACLPPSYSAESHASDHFGQLNALLAIPKPAHLYCCAWTAEPNRVAAHYAANSLHLVGGDGHPHPSTTKQHA